MNTKIRYKKELPSMDFIEKELYECAQIGAELDKRMEKLQELSRQLCRDENITSE